jgi:nucleotide-binding universal stress UspA family protein
MYKRILVAVDGSHTSELALQEAINLAKDANGVLRIVHAVDEATFNWEVEYVNPPEIWKAMAESGQALLDKAAATATQAGVRAETELIEIDTIGRRIPEVIAQAAGDWSADVIVVGTHGRRGLSHVFLGSVAEGIVRVATKPVLLIRGE